MDIASSNYSLENSNKKPKKLRNIQYMVNCWTIIILKPISLVTFKTNLNFNRKQNHLTTNYANWNKDYNFP